MIKPQTLRRRSILVLLAVAALTLLPRGLAQNPTTTPTRDPHKIVAESLNYPIELRMKWLVRQGDDPSYASPALDDSHWTVIDIRKSLSSYGITQPNFLWYRTHVHIPPGQHHLAILLRAFSGSEQIYVNGVATGPAREFNTRGGTIFANYDLQSPIPDRLVSSGDLTIAMRAQIGAVAATNVRTLGFTDQSAFLLGDAAALADQTSLSNFRQFTSNAVNISLTALVLLIALALALTLRDEPEYLALSLFLAATLCSDLLSLWRTTHEIAFNRFYDLPSQVLSATIVFSGIEFARRILQLPNARWIRGYKWVLGSLMVFGATVDAATFQTGSPNHAWLVLVFVTVLLVVVPLNLGLPLFALWIWRRTRNFDALLLSAPLLIQALFFYIRIGVTIINLVHPSSRMAIPLPPTGSFGMQWSEISDFLFTIALLGFLILRTIRLARAQAALAAEVAAAEHVQQLLLASSSRPTPGFLVESAFHPANQVGGDFFLLSPHEDGSILAIVGDVSGKGLTAALRVAMILGVLRRESSRDPVTVLSNLNEALVSQSEMGFTTACCVHLSADGWFAVANAGHIAPYLSGSELETPPALPLGIAPHQSYEIVTGQLAPSDRMVLMSDGVPEARNAKRELYGFERLASLSLLPAQAIADAALGFGQEDDITVLTLAVV